MYRFLIADDHAIFRRGLSEILQEYFPGAEVGHAPDGHSTLAAAQAGHWDLVLLDLSLPDLNGFQVLDSLSCLSPSPPVLVLSASADSEFAIRTVKLGARGFVNKQRAATDLVEAVRAVLAGQTYLSEAALKVFATQVGPRASVMPHELLSNREFAVFCQIASGKPVKEIAANLAISEKTVSTYLARIRHKTGLQTHAEMTRYAVQNGLPV